MAKDVEAIRLGGKDRLDRRVLVHRLIEIDQSSIQPGRDGIDGQQVGKTRSWFHVAHFSVRKGDLGHGREVQVTR